MSFDPQDVLTAALSQKEALDKALLNDKTYLCLSERTASRPRGVSPYPKNCCTCGARTTGQRPRCRSCGIALSKQGENNPQWKGDNVKYAGLHIYMRNKLQQPALCEHCNAEPPYDLANKGVYNRDPENWEYLCRKCHMESDGRMANLNRYPKTIVEKLCGQCEQLFMPSNSKTTFCSRECYVMSPRLTHSEETKSKMSRSATERWSKSYRCSECGTITDYWKPGEVCASCEYIGERQQEMDN